MGNSNHQALLFFSDFGWYPLCLGVLWLGLVGCTCTPKEEIQEVERMEILADKVCQCLQPVLELNLRMQELISSGRKQEVMNMTQQAAAVQQTAFSCSISQKHRSELKTYAPTLFATHLLERCPALPSNLHTEILRKLEQGG